MEVKKQRILLIDDEQDILDVIGYFLKKEGYEVEAADSGAAALEKMQANSYDVVICDYLMPKMDGISLLRKLRDRKDYTAFVFFSGNADETQEVKMIGLGAYELVPKSDFKKLPGAIKKVLKHANHMSEIRQETTQEIDDFLSILHSSK